MSNPYGNACPIWGYGVQMSPEITQRSKDKLVRCYRAGGKYRITSEVEALLTVQPEDVKARLTTLIIDKHLQGVEVPEVTADLVDEAKRKKSLSVPDRINRFLQYFYYECANAVQKYDDVNELVDYPLLFPYGDLQLAWSESISEQAVRQLFGVLVNKGFIEERITSDFIGYGLTMEGVHCIESLNSTPQTSQVFVAMWFDASMDNVYEKGIVPAIEATGYNPLRIDREAFFGKIDDEIIAEIPRSRFVVADFSHDDGGVRGSVYYEAGFAHGLGIPVIYLCRKGSDLAFDTNHYPHIIWETPEELRAQLANRIWALIGQGPNTHPLR